MSSDAELPDDVIAELAGNRKVTAIKLLRKHEGLDLTEAKKRVDAYLSDNSPSAEARAPETDTGIGRIVILVIGVGVIYGVYKYLTSS